MVLKIWGNGDLFCLYKFLCNYSDFGLIIAFIVFSTIAFFHGRERMLCEVTVDHNGCDEIYQCHDIQGSDAGPAGYFVLNSFVAIESVSSLSCQTWPTVGSHQLPIYLVRSGIEANLIQGTHEAPNSKYMITNDVKSYTTKNLTLSTIFLLDNPKKTQTIN